MSTQRPFIDLFCRVIDNYGDIGVCWRLAKDLHQRIYTQQDIFSPNSLFSQYFDQEQHGTYPIRLWVDDLISFARIEPQVQTDQARQIIDNIQVVHWHTDLLHAIDYEQTTHQPSFSITPAPVVIEAFGANLDPSFIQAMKGYTKCWFNLEYLSAESWVDNFHQQPSPQSNGVPKYFFFPGFTSKTGGLIRENTLLEDLNTFFAKPSHHIPLSPITWLEHYIHPTIAEAYQKGARLISIFCYPNAPFESLIKTFSQTYLYDRRSTIFLLPEGVLPKAEQQLQHIHQLADTIQIHRFSFLPQAQFDYLLGICDFNIVRGEDSFVRAIWSGKPFIWHIYEQKDETHLEKLQAWLTSCQAPPLLSALQLAWNRCSAWNNPTICPTYITDTQRELQRQQLEKLLVQIFTPKISHTQVMTLPIWEEIKRFHLQYRQLLCKNPTLSFSLLNFQPKYR